MHRLGILLALVVAPAVCAADINGKWTAQVESPRGTSEVNFNFTAEGDKLSGAITDPRGESDISDGKIEGDTVSFKQILNFGREITFTYTGKLSGDEIQFTRKMEGGPGGPGGGGPRAEGRAREGGQRPGGGAGGRGGGFGREVTFTAKRAK